jgi:hypothetical protein
LLLDWEYHATESAYWRMKHFGTWPGIITEDGRK